MAVRKFKPTTPGQRHKAIGTFEEITASVPEKSLVYGKRTTGGRNNTGKMTMRYLGGGHKRKFRFIDFKREKDGVPATVKTIEYDPNRSARIALLFYADGEKRYIIAPNGLKVGDVLLSGAEAAPEIGNALPLANIPVGTVIHNPGARAGGAYGLILPRIAFIMQVAWCRPLMLRSFKRGAAAPCSLTKTYLLMPGRHANIIFCSQRILSVGACLPLGIYFLIYKGNIKEYPHEGTACPTPAPAHFG